MRMPTPTQAFDATYTIAARDGREKALFGDSIALARPAFEKSLIGSGYPHSYLEFPLLGKPCFDILVVHSEVEPGARFADGAGYGYQPMFDWFSRECSQIDDVSCGIELDTSSGETERAGVYLQQRERTELVEPFLRSVGEEARAESYLDVLKRMPASWPPAYVGLFPGRPGSPLRIGGYMGHDEMKACAQDPAHLAKRFDAIGFTAYDQAMLERCSELMSLAPAVDFQFDIQQDGSLGDVFGLSLSFNKTYPRLAKECMTTGYGAELCQKLEAWGLADDRWRLIADAAFARHVAVEREDGSETRFALAIRFNYAKMKFKAAEPQLAKFYLILHGGELKDV